MNEFIRIYETTEQGAVWTGVTIAQSRAILQAIKTHSLEHMNRTFFVAKVVECDEIIDGRSVKSHTIVQYIAWAINGNVEIR